MKSILKVINNKSIQLNQAEAAMINQSAINLQFDQQEQEQYATSSNTIDTSLNNLSTTYTTSFNLNDLLTIEKSALFLKGLCQY